MGDWREELRTLGESFLQVVSELHGRTYPVHVSQLAMAVRDVLAPQERVNCWMENGLRKERTRRMELEKRLKVMEMSVERAQEKERSWREEMEKELVGVGMWKGDFENRVKGLEEDLVKSERTGRKGVSEKESLKGKSVLGRDDFDECEDDVFVPHGKPLEDESDSHPDRLRKCAETLQVAQCPKRRRVTPTFEKEPIEQMQSPAIANNVPRNTSASTKHIVDQKNNPNATSDIQVAKRPRTNAFNKHAIAAQAPIPSANPLATIPTQHKPTSNKAQADQPANNKAQAATPSNPNPLPPAVSAETPSVRPLPPLPRTDQVLQDQARRQAERRAMKRCKPPPCAKCRLRKRAIMLRERGYVNEEVFERWANKPGACLGNVHQDEPPESPPSPLSFDETETESPSDVE